MARPLFVEPGTGTGDGPGGSPVFPGGPPVLTPVVPPPRGPVTVITPGNPPIVINPQTGQQLPSDTPTITTVTVNPDGSQTVTNTAGGIGDLLNMQIFGIPAWIVGLAALIFLTGKK